MVKQKLFDCRDTDSSRYNLLKLKFKLFKI